MGLGSGGWVRNGSGGRNPQVHEEKDEIVMLHFMRERVRFGRIHCELVRLAQEAAELTEGEREGFTEDRKDHEGPSRTGH